MLKRIFSSSRVRKKLIEERDISQRLMARIKELNFRVESLFQEKLELGNMVNNAENKSEMLMISLQEMEDTISDLSKQLSESIDEHQTRLGEERRLRLELGEIKMELDQVQLITGESGFKNDAISKLNSTENM
mmetsp:Transcript_370/g.485  ORF Transcript_370/g.485 Transcript_370/m.485 type:complete len:133 (+) Transcript_370:42-440(+)